MKSRSTATSLALFLAPCLVLAAFGRTATAADSHHCQKTTFYVPKKPHIKFKSICPKRICPCCPLENFGYYPTCWQPWPFPPDYSHCPVPPIVVAAPPKSSNSKGEPEPLEELPAPQLIPKPAQPNLN